MCRGLWSPVLVWAPSPASCLASGTSLCSEVTSTRHLQSSDLSGKGRARSGQSPSWAPAGLGGHLVCLPGLSAIVSLEHSVDSTFGHTWAQRVSVTASVEQCPGLSAQNSGRPAGVKPSSPPATAGPRALGLCMPGVLPADWLTLSASAGTLCPVGPSSWSPDCLPTALPSSPQHPQSVMH